MTTISDENLLLYFKTRKNRFTNSKGMKLGLTTGNDLWTHLTLCNHDHGPLAINISTEEDSPVEFLTGFKIKSLEDIQTLDYTNSWMRYLNGEAEIDITPFELEARIVFKIIKGKTMIYSLDLHFYDEVYEHLTMAEDFERYISTHNNRLNAAEENRYRMNKR
jgi:hypothetical protein